MFQFSSFAHGKAPQMDIWLSWWKNARRHALLLDVGAVLRPFHNFLTPNSSIWDSPRLLNISHTSSSYIVLLSQPTLPWMQPKIFLVWLRQPWESSSFTWLQEQTVQHRSESTDPHFLEINASLRGLKGFKNSRFSEVNDIQHKIHRALLIVAIVPHATLISNRIPADSADSPENRQRPQAASLLCPGDASSSSKAQEGDQFTRTCVYIMGSTREKRQVFTCKEIPLTLVMFPHDICRYQSCSRMWTVITHLSASEITNTGIPW